MRTKYIQYASLFTLWFFALSLFQSYTARSQEGPETPEKEQFFSDVAPGDPYYDATAWLYERGVVEGYEDRTYQAWKEVTRSEALKMIMMGANYHFKEESNELNKESGYPDVARADWFYPFVIKATELGIVSGYPDGNFHPEKNINLAEALKIILGSFEAALPEKVEDNPYNDVNAADWHAAYFAVYKEYHLLDQDEGGNVKPAQVVTRGILAELIYKYIKREEIKAENQKQQDENSFVYGRATWYGMGDGFNGRGTANGEIFDDHAYTAAHRSLPFNTWIRVWSIEEPEKFVEVRINDRGPYAKCCILDLAGARFEELAPLGRGHIPIKYEIIEPPETAQ